MTKRVRLWGGPACGDVKNIPDYSEKVRIYVPEPLYIGAMSRPDYQMPTSVMLSEFEYNPSAYRDSQGIDVYIPENIPLGRCITENFDRMAAEFYMNGMRPAKACIVPRLVWFDFEKEYCRDQSMMWTLNMRSVDGTITFKGIRIVFGDEFKMLIAPPSSPWPTPSDRPERNEEEWRAQYEGEWHGNPSLGIPELQPYQRMLLRTMEEYAEGRPRERIQFLRTRNYGASEMMRFSEGLMYAGGEGATPDQNLQPPATTITSQTRRNRTTIYSGENTRCLFRIVFENGPKLTDERKAKLYQQYLQALKNNHMQYVENSDLL